MALGVDFDATDWAARLDWRAMLHTVVEFTNGVAQAPTYLLPHRLWSK